MTISEFQALLTPADLKMFAAFGVHADLLNAARVARVTDEQARTEYGITGKGNMEGIIFPYLNGNSRMTCRLKRDHPEIEDGKPKKKYVAPFGDVRHLYFPPGAAELLKDPDARIVFVEAEKSALAITAWAQRVGLKLVAIATGGCWAWCGTIGKTQDASGTRVDEKGPLPDLVCAENRKVIILFDADTATNSKVEAGRFAFATALRKLKAEVSTPNLPMSEDVNGPDDFLAVHGDDKLKELLDKAWMPQEQPLGSFSTRELFSQQEVKVEWLAWPLLARGLSSITDALPKLGKTRLFLEAIKASRDGRPFLNYATKPMRVIYVSEQSAASLATQAREVGFTGNEPIEELRWVTREHWSRHVYTDFLVRLEKDFLKDGNYNTLLFDTWHTVARLEDEKDASEVNRLGNVTLDVATRNKLALALGRHDRKSGGDIGVSGRSSIQLSGLADVILHLVRVPNQPTQRKLELLGRVPGLPNEQLIDLVNGAYINWGEPKPEDQITDKVAQVEEWLQDNPALTGDQIVARFAALVPPVEISVATAKRYRQNALAKKAKRRSSS